MTHRLDPAFRKPISQPVQISSESPKTANRVGCAVSTHRRHVYGCTYGCTDIDGCCVWIDHRKPGSALPVILPCASFRSSCLQKRKGWVAQL